MHVKLWREQETHTHTQSENEIWTAISYAFFVKPPISFHNADVCVFFKEAFFLLCAQPMQIDTQTNKLSSNAIERRATTAKKNQFNHHYYSKFPGVWESFLIHHRNGSNFGNHHLIVYSILMCFIVTAVVMQASLASCPLPPVFILQTFIANARYFSSLFFIAFCV